MEKGQETKVIAVAVLGWRKMQGPLEEGLRCCCRAEEVLAFAVVGMVGAVCIVIRHNDHGLDTPYKRDHHRGLGGDNLRATHHRTDNIIPRVRMSSREVRRR